MSSSASLQLPLARLADPLPIPHLSGPFALTVRPPGSKSITNRVLLLAALADGTSTVRSPLVDADDAQVMIRALTQLGARITPRTSDSQANTDALEITGVGGRWRLAPQSTVTLDLHNAGTATRFLTAAAMLAPPGSAIIIDGDARMRQRPIRELIDLLRQMGVQADYVGTDGFPPVRIEPPRGGLHELEPRHHLGTTASSQFISALMLVAPFLPRGIDLELDQPVTSFPYIEMSRQVLAMACREGPDAVTAVIEHPSDQTVRVRVAPRPASASGTAHSLRSFDFDIEPDASGATYFEAAAALFPGASVTIDGLDLGPRGALQGDTHFVRVLTEMGAKVERVGGGARAALRVTGGPRLLPIDTSLADMPDTAMTAAVLACFASPTPANPRATSILRGLRTLRVKETDRLKALRVELTKLGAHVEIVADGTDDEALRITPSAPSGPDAQRATNSPVTFDTYRDHRMAMALALVGLRRPGVQINDPACVAKTYPTYWTDLARLIEAAM